MAGEQALAERFVVGDVGTCGEECTPLNPRAAPAVEGVDTHRVECGPVWFEDVDVNAGSF